MDAANMTAARRSAPGASAGTTLLDGVRAAVARRCVPDPGVRQALATEQDAALLRRAGMLLAGLRPREPSLPAVRVAIWATCTIGAFEPLLRAALVGGGLLPVIEPGRYGGFEMALATGAITRAGQPDVVTLLAEESYFVPRDWSAADVDAFLDYAAERLEEFRDRVAASVAGTSATVIVHTIPLPGEVRDAFISWPSRTRVAQFWHRLNAAILALAQEHDQVMAVDLAGLLADAPVAARDDRLHRYGDMPYTDGALLLLAQQVRRAVQARAGLGRKVLALDLDNTLWGGVIGEVGPGGVQIGGLYPGNCYLALQRAAVRLREQGVILVLASKNDASAGEKALAGHPDVLLRPDMFSAWAVNWSAKSGNLDAAAQALGLPIRSFVFMDDSPFERAEVTSQFPEVAVVPAEGDPARLARALLQPGWFDVMTLTDTDRRRPELYRTRAERSSFSGEFGTPEDYLQALGIELAVAPATEFTAARIGQLAARTNQFNLTGIRPDAAATAAMAVASGYLVCSLSVSDRFGDDGIVGAAWVQRGPQAWDVLNLVLSCRVLGRGIEFAAVGWLASQARAAGAASIAGRFTPSKDNGVAAGFWPGAGFTAAGAGGFTLDLAGAQVRETPWITLCEPGGTRDD